jgi:hypothetical protein
MNKKPDPSDKRRNALTVIKENGKSREHPLFELSVFFGLDSFKAWLNEADQISPTNHISLRENRLYEKETPIEDTYTKYFLSENASVDDIPLRDLRGDSAEKTEEKTDFQKSGHHRNFQQANSEADFLWHRVPPAEKCEACGRFAVEYEINLVKEHQLFRRCQSCFERMRRQFSKAVWKPASEESIG